MTEGDIYSDMVGVFISAGRAHHSATGGVNPEWATWYANHMVEDVNNLLDAHLSVEEMTAWLVAADERYRSEEQEMSWPKAYAAWILDDHASSSG